MPNPKGVPTGLRHTDEWKAAQSARQNTWTDSEVAFVRFWYTDRRDKPLELAKLCATLGRPEITVCRKARALGLTTRTRKTGRKPTAKHPTAEAARAATAAATRRRIAEHGHPRGMLGKKQKPGVLARARAAAQEWARTATPERKRAAVDKAQATLMARYGTLAPGMQADRNPHSRVKYGRRDDLGGQFFRSAWEANYARYLNFLIARGLVARWEFEADTFWFEAIRRGVRSYKPDFKVTEPGGAVYYVEVKGWMDDKSKTKLARMARYHPTVDLRLVGAKAYYEIERTIGRGLPGWE